MKVRFIQSGGFAGLIRHCSLTPAALPTWAHFSISVFTSAANCSPVPPTVVAP